MPLSSSDKPGAAKAADKPDAKPDEQSPAELAANPHASTDPAFKDDPGQELDPTKVVGTYAMQPDPNAARPAPTPNVPPGVHEAPADDEPGAPAIGDGSA